MAKDKKGKIRSLYMDDESWDNANLYAKAFGMSISKYTKLLYRLTYPRPIMTEAVWEVYKLLNEIKSILLENGAEFENDELNEVLNKLNDIYIEFKKEFFPQRKMLKEEIKNAIKDVLEKNLSKEK